MENRSKEGINKFLKLHTHSFLTLALENTDFSLQSLEYLLNNFPTESIFKFFKNNDFSYLKCLLKTTSNPKYYNKARKTILLKKINMLSKFENEEIQEFLKENLEFMDQE